jgi:hypothetical protein
MCSSLMIRFDQVVRSGPAAWCIRQRGRMPQKPVEEEMRREGKWSLDDLISPQVRQDHGSS